MTRDHARIEELMAVDALGGLDEDDRAALARERASHGEHCPTCTAIEAGFAETAGRLAFALTPEPVGEAMAERILATPRDELAARRSRRPRAWGVLVAAAAVAAIAIVAVGALRPSSTPVSGASSSQRIVAFSGQPEGTLAMAFTPGEPGAVLWGGGLPDLGADEVYEIWMIEGGTPVSGGCIAPTDGVIGSSIEADIGSAEAMAVTKESAHCPLAPTTDPVMLADLTTVV
jgi:anti-sigma-K factor RskA